MLLRHPLVPLAILTLAADAFYLSAVARPRQERFLASIAPESNEKARRLRVVGEVCAVRAPVPATRGELKYRFRIKNPHFLDLDDHEIEMARGTLPVIWYSPRPEKAGFPPEPGAIFNLEGKIFVRRRVADGIPHNLDDLFLVTRARATRVVATRRGNSGDFLSRIRYSAAERITRGLDRLPDERALILAMILGFRSDIPPDLLRIFRHAGTIHIFAISGLHIVLIAGILAKCLALLGISRRYWILPLVPLLALYIFLTGGQPSALRAGLMAVFYHAAPLFGRRPDPLNAIACAVLVLVPADPNIAGELGFILSFSMVTGLVIFLAPVQALFHRLFQVDATADALTVDRLAAGPLSFWGEIAFRIRHFPLKIRLWGAKQIPLAIVATLVSFPLTAYFFGFCSSYALLANLFAVQLAGLVMTCSALGLALSCLHPFLAMPANLCAGAAAWAMKILSVGAASLPGSSPHLRFSFAALVTWYSLLGLICAALRRRAVGKRQREWWKKDMR